MVRIHQAILLLMMVAATACGRSDVDRAQGANAGGPGLGDRAVNEEIGSDLRELAQSRIYFGRHSVGRNILSGLGQLAAEHGVDGIHIVDLDSEEHLPDAFLAHSRVGENLDPKSKIDDFAARMRGGLPVKPDVAMMKFCYVDFNPDTNVRELFDYYRSTLDQLSTEFPDVRFLHATVPLMTREIGLKERIKLLLGQTLWGDDSNIKREEFSGLLRQTYDQNRVVEIARVESTNPDGTQEQFTIDGEPHPSLSPAYTTDGGHLNVAGQRQVAAHMVRVLARNSRQND